MNCANIPVLLALLLGGCAAPGPRLLEPVPDVRQTTDYSCGVAALVAVLGYYGVAADERALIRERKVDPEVGAEREDLAALAARRGVVLAVRDGLSLADLEREIAAARPVIVLNQSWREDPAVAWRDEWDAGHYLVVIGIDRESVYVEDPSLVGARGVIPRREFVERWHGWTLDQRQGHGQALLVRSAPSPASPRSGPVRLEPVP